MFKSPDLGSEIVAGVLIFVCVDLGNFNENVLSCFYGLWKSLSFNLGDFGCVVVADT